MLIRLLLIFCLITKTLNAFALSGIVLDEQGQRISGAAIKIFANNMTTTVYSSAGGAFEFQNLPMNSGAVNVVVSKSGYIEKTLNNLATNSNIVVTCNKAIHTLSGQVLDSSGNPVSNVLISAGDLGSFTTDQNGAFSLTAPHDTNYHLNGSLVDYYLGEPVSGILEGDTRRVLLALWE